MKLALLACLVALSAASPQFSRFFPRPTHRLAAPQPVQRPAPQPAPRQSFNQPQYRVIEVLRDNRADQGDGNYNYEFETENGIYTNVQGSSGAFGQSNQAGSFRFTLPDGTLAQVNFVADENGYRVDSPLIPQAPPMPAHAIEQIRKAEEERARGVQFDNHGFRIGGF